MSCDREYYNMMAKALNDSMKNGTSLVKVKVKMENKPKYTGSRKALKKARGEK